jgi:hypothetical protein
VHTTSTPLEPAEEKLGRQLAAGWLIFSDFFLSTALTLQASAELFLSGLEGR